MRRLLVVLGVVVASAAVGILALIGSAHLQVELADPEPCRDTFIIERDTDSGPVGLPACAAPTADPVPTFASGLAASAATAGGTTWAIRRRARA